MTESKSKVVVSMQASVNISEMRNIGNLLNALTRMAAPTGSPIRVKFSGKDVWLVAEWGVAANGDIRMDPSILASLHNPTDLR